MSENPRYNLITELPTTLASNQQLSQMYTRYNWAKDFVKDQKVLEIGCGFGIGLKYFYKHGAKYVMGYDIDQENIKIGKQITGDNQSVAIQLNNIEDVEFENESYDVIVIFETIYYFKDYKKLLMRLRDILTPNGRLLISTVNCRWSQFNRSPFSVHYPDKTELVDSLMRCGYDVKVKGGFPEVSDSILKSIVRIIRIMTVKLGLIPKTMKGKQLLKRIFYGKLKPIPNQIYDGMANIEPLDCIYGSISGDKYAFLYIESKKVQN